MIPINMDVLRQIATKYRLGLEDNDLAEFVPEVAKALESYQRLDSIPSPTLSQPVGPRTAYVPEPADNPWGAWAVCAEITENSSGPLAGKRIAIKDNVAVAGVPMTNGTSLLRDYVPEFDATVVSRILAAGGTIGGKAVCEHLCFSGSSFTSDSGPVRNPWDPSRATGGSSSGNAALIATGAVDMAVGGDQGGSVRIPAAWCGIYGLKPTHGLVPYTGAFPIEVTLDHLGPMAATVSDIALLLEVMAGPDGLDPRSTGATAGRYTEALANSVAGLRVGVLSEGFGIDGVSEPDVDRSVREAAQRLADLGADVVDVSVPAHLQGSDIWNAIATEGALNLMIDGYGMGSGWKGHYSTSMMQAFANGSSDGLAAVSDSVKLVILTGGHVRHMTKGSMYAKAQNASRLLKAAYDDALSRVDVLLMPTTPMKATRIPDRDEPLADRMNLALGMMHNTCPFDVTGHPAMSVPVAISDGLPVGMMLVAEDGGESTLIAAAAALEATAGVGALPFAAATPPVQPAHYSGGAGDD